MHLVLNFAKTYPEDSLNKLNLYSLKRILTDKSLDLLEGFELKDLDTFYQRYASFSAEIAREHSSLLITPIRQDSDISTHLKWAESMPIQNIKSEFIIKLHTVMNGL